jgi:uncharacterized protein (DUF2249 family)
MKPPHTSRGGRRNRNRTAFRSLDRASSFGGWHRRTTKPRRLGIELLEDRALLSSVTGLVWNDLNANGLQDAGEPGVSGVVVELLQYGSYRSIATTDKNGVYVHTGLGQGSQYELVFRTPGGYSFTTRDAGDDARDSDVDGTGRTLQFTLGAADVHLDAGLRGAAPTFGFALSAGAATYNSADYREAVATDAAGNIYVAGSFEGTADFDPGVGATTLSSGTYASTYVAKYSNAGALYWARCLGGMAGDIAVGSDGSVYTVGFFYDTGDFDPGTSVFNLTSAGNTDVFLSKLDSAGRFVWARRIGGALADYGLGLAVAADGSVCVTGTFQATVDFDPGSGVYNLSSAGDRDAFVAKYSSSGVLTWACRLGGYSGDGAYDIALDVDGSVYTTGSFQGTADFDPGPGTFYYTSASGSYGTDVFVSKLDSAGNFVWARRMGEGNDAFGYGIAVAPDGCVYTTGYFSGTADFDTGSSTSNLVSAGSWDVFVTKLNSSGDFVWARRLGGSAADECFGIVVGPDGSVYTAGWFIGTSDFDPGPGTFYLSSASSDKSDAFISRLDAAGNFAGAFRMGGGGSDGAAAITILPDGYVCTAGDFNATADFDPRSSTFTLTTVGGHDYETFLAVLLPNRAPADIALSSASVCQSSPRGTVVGTLSASDPDDGQTFAYELLDSAGGRFMLTGSVLRVADGTLLDRTLATSHNVTVRVRDDFGGAYVKTLTIDVAAAGTRRSVGNRVWLDLNGNGLQDAGEPGIADAVVEVFNTVDATIGNADDVSWGLTSTDSSGNYALPELIEGLNYYLVFRLPAGYSFTAPDRGGDDALDSDAGANGVTGLFTLAPGTDRIDFDAGVVGVAPAFGFAFPTAYANNDSVQSLATDAAGNVYFAGYFSGTADFDPGPGVCSVATAGSNDIFVAKYTRSGALYWAVRFGGAEDDRPGGIAVAPAGDVYLTGSFKGQADFDPSAGLLPILSNGGIDAFMLRLDPLGNLVWAHGVGNSGTYNEYADYGYDVALGPDGSVCVTGTFYGTVDFDPGPATYNLTSVAYNDAFVWKLDAAGDFVWAKRMGGSSGDQGQRIAVAADGNIYTAGRFAATADFNPGPDAYNLTARGNYDAFVSKLDSEGNFLWARSMGGTKADYVFGIALDADGSVYTTGTFEETADFDPGAGTFNLAGGGGFLSKLDVSGNFAWACRLGGKVYDVAVAADGSVHATGHFGGLTDFDPGPETFKLPIGGTFVATFDSAGGFVWACRMDGAGGYAIAPAADGGLFVSGYFQGPADFDPRASVFNVLDAGGSTNYLCKLLPDRAPVDIALSPATVFEFSPRNTLVGALSAVDPDADEAFTYELRDSAGGRFMLVESAILVDKGTLLDSDQAASHDIVVRVRDSYGVFCDRTLTIAVAEATSKFAASGSVWSDANANGIQDAGEPGVAGAVVEVFQSFDGVAANGDDVSWGQTATDSAGAYSFNGLYAGLNYYLVFRTPPGYAFTAQDAGGDDGRDSDVNAGGTTALFLLAAGKDRIDLDAGVTGTSSGFGFGVPLGGSSVDGGQAVTTDAAGNVYVTGCFRTTVDFDPGPGSYAFTSANSTSSGVTQYYADLFVAKYSASGALYWARHAGRPSAAGDGACGYGIVVGPDGSVYITGQYGNTTDFDPGPAVFDLPQNSNTETFVWKLDAAGSFVWAVHLGGPSWDRGCAIALAPDGGVCTTGYFTGTADFDPGPGVYNLTAATTNTRGGIYVSKLDAAGNFLWAGTPGGTCSGQGNGIGVAPDGNVYAVGQYSGTADFDPGIGTFNLAASGTDVFIWTLDSAGSFLRAARMGGISTDIGYGIAVGLDGSAYTTGYFNGTADFDPGAGTQNLVSAGSNDAFVSKLNADGSFAWARRMGGTGADAGYAIALAADSGIYTAGSFRNTADFDPGAGTANFVSNGNYDIYVSRLDAAGNFVWATSCGGTVEDYGYGIAVTPNGSVYATGSFQGTADFDPSSGVFNLTSGGSADAFLWKVRGNQAPTDISLSPASVLENSPTGTVVGTIRIVDPDANESFTYELLDSAGGRFKLVGSQLLVDNGTLLNYEQAVSHDVIIRVRDYFGAAFEKTLTVGVLDVDEFGPRIAGVFVRGTAWSNAFLDALDGQGLGHGTIARLGYAVPTGAAQLKALPWTNLNTIGVAFSEDVVVQQGNLTLVGVNAASYNVAGGTFAYNAATHVATWTLPLTLPADKLLLTIKGVKDAAGNALDGEWTNGASAFPSGNAVPGGDFAYRFNILPGDVTQDGLVISNDVAKVNLALGTLPGHPAYSVWMDVTGDAMIISNDLAKVTSKMGTALPAGEPLASMPQLALASPRVAPMGRLLTLSPPPPLAAVSLTAGSTSAFVGPLPAVVLTPAAAEAALAASAVVPIPAPTDTAAAPTSVTAAPVATQAASTADSTSLDNLTLLLALEQLIATASSSRRLQTVDAVLAEGLSYLADPSDAFTVVQPVARKTLVQPVCA